MFIKVFSTRSNVQVKTSEVKKLKQKFKEQYELSESDLNSLFPSSKVTYQIVKIVTHGGDNINVLTIDKKPMFFEYDSRWFPTLYSLWQASFQSVPLFTTHPPVLKSLANGANLMEPGVIRQGNDLNSYGKLKKNQIAAVNLSNNSSAVAVGVLERDSMDMYMSGGRGICVKIFHVFGDKLWGMEQSVTQQIPLSNAVFVAPKLNDENDFPALGAEPPEKKQNENNNLNKVSDGNQEEVAENESDINDSNPATLHPDEILKLMFLKSLKSNKKELMSKLPMIAAIFYPSYVLKQAENENNPITIKDTSYKKVSTFFKKMSDEGFIVMREETKGVEKIVSINFDHPEVTFVKVSKTETTPESNHNLMLTKMTELYVVNDDTKNIFSCLGVSEGTSLDSTQIKNYVKDYVARKKLINTLTKQVNLDENLIEICGVTRDNIQEPLTMSLEQVIGLTISRMTTTFEMRSSSAPQTKGGKRVVIQISTATRSGNKKITMIRNLDLYGVNMAEFSKACKLGVQASTSITKVPGTDQDQFQIQGNQVKFIYDLLTEKFGVTKNNITGLEFAKKEKSKKK